MVCHARSASASRRRPPKPRQLLPAMLPVLATLDLSKPAERQAHDFLYRATSKQHRFWTLLDMRRQGDWLLCVVRWVYPDNMDKPYSLTEVGLKEMAVRWQDYATDEAARSELERRCMMSSALTGGGSG